MQVNRAQEVHSNKYWKMKKEIFLYKILKAIIFHMNYQHNFKILNLKIIKNEFYIKSNFVFENLDQESNKVNLISYYRKLQLINIIIFKIELI